MNKVSIKFAILSEKKFIKSIDNKSIDISAQESTSKGSQLIFCHLHESW